MWVWLKLFLLQFISQIGFLQQKQEFNKNLGK